MPKRPASKSTEPAQRKAAERTNERLAARQRRPPADPTVTKVSREDAAAVDEAAERARGYPLFPEISPGLIRSMPVFRLVASPRGKSVEPKQVAFTFDPWVTDRAHVGHMCGGGSFLVQARGAAGTILDAVKFDLEGSPKEPGAQDAAEQSKLTAHETAGGWVTLPEVEPAINAALVGFQQAANNSRQDANSALDALGKTNAALLTHFASVVDSLASVQRAPTQSSSDVQTIAELRAENNKLRDKVGELERSNLKLELMQQFKLSPIESAVTKAIDGDAMQGIMKMLVDALMPKSQKANVTQNPPATNNLPGPIPAEVRA